MKELQANEMAVLNYLKYTYGGKATVKNNFLCIEVDNDVFRVNLTDKERFGFYTFFHRNSARRLDGTYNYHTQLKVQNLGRGLFFVWTHSIGKSIGVKETEEDWRKFQKDAMRFNKRER